VNTIGTGSTATESFVDVFTRLADEEGISYTGMEACKASLIPVGPNSGQLAPSLIARRTINLTVDLLPMLFIDCFGSDWISLPAKVQ
jgi:hypothetical protein